MTTIENLKKIDQDCEHLEHEADTKVNTVEISDETDPANVKVTKLLQMVIKVRCLKCKLQFHFKHLPTGVGVYLPALSVDSYELRVPIYPGEMPLIGDFTKAKPN